MTTQRSLRPWGSYVVLEDRPTHKVKRMEVDPGCRLSYQRHQHRSEHWVVVARTADVVLEDRTVRLAPGEAIVVPRGAAHRVGNPGADLLVLVEVQLGDYFGEDDIERLEDDFGRAPTG